MNNTTGTYARKITLLLCGLSFIVLGTTENHLPYLVIGQVLVGLLFFSRIYLEWNRNALTVTREMKLRALEGETVTVTLLVTSETFLPLRWVYIRDYFGADVSSHREFFAPQFTRRGQVKIYSYKGECNHGRGKYQIGPTVAVLSDPLGLWTIRREVIGREKMVVLPQVVNLSSLPGGGAKSPYFVGTRTTYKAGQSYDFFGTREYRYGDSLKYIHWPSTAHSGKLIIKEFQLHTTTRLTVFIDLYEKSLQGFKPNTLDYSVKIAASVCQYAADNNLEFRIIGRNRHRNYTLPMGKGPLHLAWVLEELASMKPLGEDPLEEVLTESLPQIQAGEQVMIIFSTHFMDLQKYIDAFTILQAKDVSITAVFLVSETFQRLRETDENRDFILTSDLPAFLASQGIHVVAVEKGANLSRCFEEGI